MGRDSESTGDRVANKIYKIAARFDPLFQRVNSRASGCVNGCRLSRSLIKHRKIVSDGTVPFFRIKLAVFFRQSNSFRSLPFHTDCYITATL